MIESSLFLALESGDPEAMKDAILTNLQFIDVEQLADFLVGHLAALRSAGMLQ